MNWKFHETAKDKNLSLHQLWKLMRISTFQQAWCAARTVKMAMLYWERTTICSLLRGCNIFDIHGPNSIAAWTDAWPETKILVEWSVNHPHIRQHYANCLRRRIWSLLAAQDLVLNTQQMYAPYRVDHSTHLHNLQDSQFDGCEEGSISAELHEIRLLNLQHCHTYRVSNLKSGSTQKLGVSSSSNLHGEWVRMFVIYNHRRKW